MPRDVPHICPLCRKEKSVILVFRLKATPFACTKCAGSRVALPFASREGVDIDRAAAAAWPDVSDQERDIRIGVLLYEWFRLAQPNPPAPVYDLMDAEAACELMGGAARAGGWKT